MEFWWLVGVNGHRELMPEHFPILWHAQFEDMFNHNFSDPVTGSNFF